MTDTDRLAALLHECGVNCYEVSCDIYTVKAHDDDAARLIAAGVRVDAAHDWERYDTFFSRCSRCGWGWKAARDNNFPCPGFNIIESMPVPFRAASTPPDALDVERLADAIHLTVSVRSDETDEWLVADEAAKIIAREYAALRETP